MSITFVIIQLIVTAPEHRPYWGGRHAAADALLTDELLAVPQFLRRRIRPARACCVFLFGDSDDGRAKPAHDEFDRRPQTIAAEIFRGDLP